MDGFYFQCNICERTFRTIQSRHQHLYSGVHGADPYPYKCNGECGEEFHTEDELIRHIDELHCIVCDRSFGSARSLQQHVRDSPSHAHYLEAYGVPTVLPPRRRQQRHPDRRHHVRSPSPAMPQPIMPAYSTYSTSLYDAPLSRGPPPRQRLASTGIEQQLLDAAAAEAALIYSQQSRTPDTPPRAASPGRGSHGSPGFDFDFEFRVGLELPRFTPTPDSRGGYPRPSRPGQQRGRIPRHGSNGGSRSMGIPSIGLLNPFLWLDSPTDDPAVEQASSDSYDHPLESSPSPPTSPSSYGDFIDDVDDDVDHLALTTSHDDFSDDLLPPRPPSKSTNRLPPPLPPASPAAPNPEPCFFGPLTLQEELASMAEKMEAMQMKMVTMEAELDAAKATIQHEESLRQCGMCYERSTDSVTKCGHQFCGVCIDSWQAQHQAPWQTPCPMCRKPMGKAIKFYRAESSA